MFRQHSASSRFLCQEKEWPRMDAKRREKLRVHLRTCPATKPLRCHLKRHADAFRSQNMNQDGNEGLCAPLFTSLILFITTPTRCNLFRRICRKLLVVIRFAPIGSALPCSLRGLYPCYKPLQYLQQLKEVQSEQIPHGELSDFFCF